MHPISSMVGGIYHDPGDLFKSHLGCRSSVLGCEEPVSHFILEPNLLNWVSRSHVDHYIYTMYVVTK